MIVIVFYHSSLLHSLSFLSFLLGIFVYYLPIDLIQNVHILDTMNNTKSFLVHFGTLPLFRFEGKSLLSLEAYFELVEELR